MTTASSVPATIRSMSDLSRSALVGFRTKLSVEPPDADGADGRVERDERAGQRDGGAVDGQDVGVVLAVGREDEGDDLRLVVEALGEERPDGPVDQPGGQDLLLGRPALALEPAAGDASRGVGVLAVVDGQREEIGVLLRLLVEDGGGEDDGVAEADDGGAVGLLGELADLDVEGLRADGDGDLVDHGLVPFLSIGVGGRPSGRRWRAKPAAVGRGGRRSGAATDYFRRPRRSISLW